MREFTRQCYICGKLIPYRGPKLCDPCGQLDRLILHYREQAKKILEYTKWREDDK